MAVHVFAGPTVSAAEARAIVPDAHIHPPISHGDLLRLRFGSTDTVVIIDGHYHQSGAVRHKEILEVLASGATVIGCSSMGALRAAELDALGMIGRGTVYSLYRDGVIDADGEVAVSHGEAPEYRRLSESLVNIRHVLQHASAVGAITASAAARLIEAARLLPYTERSWQLLERRVASDAELDEALRAALSRTAVSPGIRDIKRADALETLREVAHGSPPTGAPLDWMRSDAWRSTHLRSWAAEFTGEPVEGVHVGTATAVQFVQLYDDGFPRRWRQHALGVIAALSSELPATLLEDGALAAAGELGITRRALTHKQFSSWTSDVEQSSLTGSELLLRLLVRSFRSPRTAAELLVDAPWLYPSLPVARQAAAEAHLVNEEFRRLDPGYELLNLRPELLEEHLVQIWRPPGRGDIDLRLAAQDRGFRSFHEAVEAARFFLLRHQLALHEDGQGSDA
ncbi:TfuA-like protein [Kitasatospora sp. NPDC057692]|uniref:TfuA-like protein n=1 Tax=Kitasatospora sp. NPDC057692 TaxID=3346215 RepID=UPI003687055D